jgi:hypothetical protein
LAAHPCEIWWEWDPTDLEFHHLYGKDKAISKMIAEGATVEKLKSEIKSTRFFVVTATGGLLQRTGVV